MCISYVVYCILTCIYIHTIFSTYIHRYSTWLYIWRLYVNEKNKKPAINFQYCNFFCRLVDQFPFHLSLSLSSPATRGSNERRERERETVAKLSMPAHKRGRAGDDDDDEGERERDENNNAVKEEEDKDGPGNVSCLCNPLWVLCVSLTWKNLFLFWRSILGSIDSSQIPMEAVQMTTLQTIQSISLPLSHIYVCARVCVHVLKRMFRCASFHFLSLPINFD